MGIVDHTLPLPDYRDQAPEVAARFARIRERPVILEVDQLTRQFHSEGATCTALEALSFEVRRRELVCVIGPSGCGKSTLLRIVAGLDEPTGGRVLLDGKSVEGPGADRGMVFQGYTLFPWRTVRENVMFGLEVAGKGRFIADQEARQWIDLVGLKRFADAYPHQLSGGMKQRVAIARALANGPRILLMDEPFGALDAQTRAQMQSYLLQIWKKVDVTILFITHDLDEAAYLADRVLVLGANPGHLVEFIENPVPRPRRPDQFLSPEFIALKRRLEELIHPPIEIEEEKLPMVKLTGAGDEVE
ncbi:MAG: ABC transporter ATP-binding protein [Chthoniobacteraceae bacterium]